MICNNCIYEPMCWRVAVGTKITKDCEDFKGKDRFVELPYKTKERVETELAEKFRTGDV